ncbi:hypothetical protein XF24_00956 [candidate division SR1 bacterium Aalborg_AAW-1]|nr:hypothetical protein XF24_00956 [candidate division SR1 bacterium Aalborg_AAW-1]
MSLEYIPEGTSTDKVEYNCYSYVLAQLLNDEHIYGKGDEALLPYKKKKILSYTIDRDSDPSYEIEELLSEQYTEGNIKKFPLIGELYDAETNNSIHAFLIDEDFRIHHQNGNNGPIYEKQTAQTLNQLLDDDLYRDTKSLNIKFFDIKENYNFFTT